MIKHKCPAPKCLVNKKGICCGDCERKEYCSDVCLNNVSKCGAIKY